MQQTTFIDELYLTRRVDLVNYSSRILGDRIDAEDIVQEAYIRFGAAFARERPADPIGYLVRIVRNLSIDLGRRISRERERCAEPCDGAEGDHGDARPSPEIVVADRQELQVLALAIAELPERTRRALEMHRLGGRTLAEIARELGVSVGTAHALVARGLDHCRVRLQRG